MSNLPIIDLIFLILIVLMVIHGYVKGFVEKVFSWAAVVFAIWIAILLHPAGAEFIRNRIMPNVRLVPEILSFVVIFTLGMVILKMLEHILKDVVNGAKLDGMNKVLGLIFGLFEGFALTAIILFIFTVQPVFDASNVIEDSIFAQILLPLIQIPLNRGRETIEIACLFLREQLPHIPV